MLRRRFPALIGPHHTDICYATQNRQDAVRALAERCQRVIVIGAPHSSNSVRMIEVAEESGSSAHLIESPDGIRPEWLDSVTDLGLSSSASAPEHLVRSTIGRSRRRPTSNSGSSAGRRRSLSSCRRHSPICANFGARRYHSPHRHGALP